MTDIQLQAADGSGTFKALRAATTANGRGAELLFETLG